MSAYQLGELIGSISAPIILAIIFSTIYYLSKRKSKTFLIAFFNPFIWGIAFLWTGYIVIKIVNSESPSGPTRINETKFFNGMKSGCLKTAVNNPEINADEFCSCVVNKYESNYSAQELYFLLKNDKENFSKIQFEVVKYCSQ